MNVTSALFRQKIADGDTIILAGGYLFEVERRGYIKAGEFVPKVALDHPEVLRQVTRDFVRAGSDIALAFTYNGHREKMRTIGEEHLLEPLNREALRIAREVAQEETEECGRPVFVAGNISNSNIYEVNSCIIKIYKLVKRQFLITCLCIYFIHCKFSFRYSWGAKRI